MTCGFLNRFNFQFKSCSNLDAEYTSQPVLRELEAAEISSIKSTKPRFEADLFGLKTQLNVDGLACFVTGAAQDQQHVRVPSARWSFVGDSGIGLAAHSNALSHSYAGLPCRC